MVKIPLLRREEPKCGNCHFWRDQLDNMGVCRFNPPPQPPTRSYHWCGRWQKLKKKGRPDG